MLTNSLIYQLDEGAFEPVKSRPHDAGFDLASREDVFLEPERIYKFDTGVHFHIPEGYAGFILPRSGMSISGVQSVTGVIDCNYTGSVCVLLWRHKSSHNAKIFKGQRIAQIVIYAVPNWQLVRGEVQDLHAERGEQGFGSSGL